MSTGSFVQKLRNLWRFAARQKVSLFAAYSAYFLVLAAFPSVVLLLSLLRYSGLQLGTLLDLLGQVFPQALMPSVERLLLGAYYNTSGAVVSLSAVTALWSAGRGVYGLMQGLNGVYGVKESRSWLYTRLISVGYTFGFLVVLQLSLGLHVFGNYLIDLARQQAGFWLFLAEVVDLRFFLLFFLQTGLFTAMFMVLPNEKNSFMESLPGALLASLGWLIFSDLYSVYVESTAGYSGLFGSVYAMALSMLWLYFCMSILFYGGVLNRYLTESGG